MLATQYAEWIGIETQQDGESDASFTDRVSGALRDRGCIIEAHEVAQNKRYDEDGADMVMAGITGAVAMALQGVDYGRTGSRLVGDEIAAGVVATSPKKQGGLAEVMLALLLAER